MRIILKFIILFCILFSVIYSGCRQDIAVKIPEEKSEEISEEVTDEEITKITPSPITIYVEENIPSYLKNALKRVVDDKSNNFSLTNDFNNTKLKIGLKEGIGTKEDKKDEEFYSQIYTKILVPIVPFFTNADDINWNDIKLYWNGKIEALNYLTDDESTPTLLVSDDTLTSLTNLLGYPAKDVSIRVFQMKIFWNHIGTKQIYGQ